MVVILTSIAVAVMVQSCGPKAFTKGAYDDPNKIVLLDDKFNENDMQLMAKKLVDSLVADPIIANIKTKPTIMVGNVRNRTEEHIDVKSLTDKIRTALIQSRRFNFIDKEARQEIAEEYEYQGSGYVAPETKKGPGKQVGADYLITGDISSNIQEVGNDKVIYYKVTMNLTNLEKNMIEWSDEKEIRKRYKKRNISM